MDKPWLDIEIVANLIRLNDKGLSAGLIAQKLGNGISRCAVIGKLGRMGIALKNASQSQRSRKPATGSVYGRSKPKPPPEPPLVEAKDIIPIGLGLMDLTDQHCHWPYGDGPAITFCGHSVAHGKNLCGAHWQIAHPKQAAHGAGNGSGMRSDRQFQT